MRASLLWVLICMAPGGVLAAAPSPCDRRAPASEFSWNPGKQLVTAGLHRFYQLGDEVGNAYQRADDVELTKLANEYLELAAVYRCNWNYGNAIHDANRYLGLASLRRGNIEEASRFLLLAGKSTGSPQLDSFGPDLDLANELLKRGQSAAVTEYLRDVKRFWEMDDGAVDDWLAAISKGERPALDRFSVKPSLWDVAIDWGIAAFPAVLTLFWLYVARNRLRRKVAFVVVSGLSAYGTLYLLGWGMSFLMPRLIYTFASLGKLGQYLLTYLPLALALAVPALVVMAAVKYFSGPRTTGVTTPV